MTQKTNKRFRKGFLTTLITIALATSVGAYGTFAYFTDTETSTSNLFSAGTLDLTLEHPDDVNAFISATNFAPGDVVDGNLTLKNTGSISSNDGDGHTVSLSMSTDLTSTDADAGTTDMAEYLEVSILDYDGASVLPTVAEADANGNGYIDLADLEGYDLTGMNDPGAAGKVLDLEVHFHTSGGNDLQGDSVNAAFSFTLEQS